ncbi:unnamed protein product [Brachionus calyciflorus]|uniref:Cationic amino acid transporter C-terminal domain-containing protein n=1 Tax=Brachionus calyciflorus TaxID=104777 RepID=A0A813Q2S6_9BILA|nr:unnamed protein product [Brachionus calyciflorus]
MPFTFDYIFRKKNLDNDLLEKTQLSRVLGLLDITALGISSTLGSGIYVLSGAVITQYSGPGIIFSFIIAAFATLLSGLCYAELGAKVPRSGSAYIYIYVTIGEFFGFIMGWDLILEYVIGVSASTNSLSQYINSLAGDKIREYLRNAIPINIRSLASYPDFLAFGLAIVITILLLVGVKESTFLNKLFTVFNILIILFITICGAIKADFKNWSVQADYNQTYLSNLTNYSPPYSCSAESERCGKGGFIPFGMNGIVGGAAKCFYAYIGFDTIASAGEETLRPKRNIPLSIIITLIVVTILYCGLSLVITLMIPYHLLDPNIPLPQAFEYVHLTWAKHVVSIGAVVSLSTCLYASMFPLPRIVYAMSSDGLIFGCFSKILPKFKTPYIACIVSGLLAGIFSSLLDLNELVDMMSIGTLIAYSLVTVCVMILRYKPSKSSKFFEINKNISMITLKEGKKLKNRSVVGLVFGESSQSIFLRLFKPNSDCSVLTSRIVNIFCVIEILAIIAICILVSSTINFHFYIIIILALLFLIVILCMLVIWRQPQNEEITTFKAPLVPLLPTVSLFFNIYLIMSLTLTSWIRFFVWFGLGVIVYMVYGVRNSVENTNQNERNFLCPCMTKKPKQNFENSVQNEEFQFEETSFQ